ncbi:hypothetical protein PCASD_02950 [Puccinia coronata f. sp. avenae]|uniref:Uncharacterized protein n=1 Tax=Puccinia coronata f. sp. avenae TaxID=200324 RepID=A0A2N5VED2_9BASI|nr:hypothetical protein PCASD_02950 [Puccinia coronata f. sp. avenae]
MATLSDLPAELVNRIAFHVLYPDPPPERCFSRWCIHDHHLPDHLNRSVQPKPRPHLERIIERDPNYPEYYEEEFSWPEGLPDNPLLPLSLVNHKFRQGAQELLFKNVALQNTLTASLFLKSLTSIPYEDASSHKQSQEDNRDKQRHDLPRLSPLSQHVRSLQFNWDVPCLMEEGGPTLFCKILQNCPFLENIAISNSFRVTRKEPILKALASKPHINEFVVLNNISVENTVFQWQAHEEAPRLFSCWNSLETVELSGLSGWPVNSIKQAPSSTPILTNCAIRTMILNDLNLDEPALSSLLKSCGESMRTLKISGPSYRLDRAALCRVLQERTNPKFESLTLKSICWDESISSNLNSGDPLKCHGLLGIVLNSPNSLKSLKSLSFDGSVATSRLIERLPKSIVRLSWERCKIRASVFIKALETTESLPNLKCCSYRTSTDWDNQDEWNVVEALKKQGGCSHSVLHRGFPPISTESATDSDDTSPSEHESTSSFSEHDSAPSEHASSSATHDPALKTLA